VTGHAGQAPGVVKVRLLGAAEDIAAVADLLTDAGSAYLDASASAARNASRAAACYGWQVIDRSAPYLNRRNPGARLYLTLTTTPQAQGAAR
jgi:hypothetical protein